MGHLVKSPALSQIPRETQLFFFALNRLAGGSVWHAGGAVSGFFVLCGNGELRSQTSSGNLLDTMRVGSLACSVVYSFDGFPACRYLDAATHGHRCTSSATNSLSDYPFTMCGWGVLAPRGTTRHPTSCVLSLYSMGGSRSIVGVEHSVFNTSVSRRIAYIFVLP